MSDLKGEGPDGTCPQCRCLKRAHHGPKIGCEGLGGNCGCDKIFPYKCPICSSYMETENNYWQHNEILHKQKNGASMSERITFSGATEVSHNYVETTLKIENGTTYALIGFELRRDENGKNCLVIKADNCPEEVEVKFLDKNDKLLLDFEEKADLTGENVQLPDFDTELPPDTEADTTEEPEHEIHDAENVDGVVTPTIKDQFGHEMILRANRKNGRKFWGCSQYPKCHETKRYVE